MKLTDEMVERAARAIMAERDGEDYGIQATEYDRDLARAALEASGLVDQSARADLSRVFYAKALESLRGAVGVLVDGLEDEGDRVYLGSTNHADMIRDAWHEMDALAWDEIMEDTQPKTELAAVNLQLQERISEQSERIKELEAELATATEALVRANAPSWFYHPDHTEVCQWSPYEVVDDYYDPEPGKHVFEVECAKPLPSIWCAVHCLTEDEQAAMGTDDRFVMTEHATEEEACIALDAIKKKNVA